MQPMNIQEPSNNNENRRLAQEADDVKILESMGYKQDLSRGLGAFMNFAFGFTEVSVLACISAVFGYGLLTGGPQCIIWGWMITFAFTMCVAYSMAEICGAYPSAGSVYHWAGMIVPKEWNPICAYVCGWCNFLGNAAGDASFAASWTTFLTASISVCGGQSVTTGEYVGISIGILLVWTLLNSFEISKVGWVNAVAAFVQVGTVIIMVIGLLSRAPQLSTGAFVFTQYNNATGFTDASYVWAIGLLTALFSFSGYEASAHMAEETKGSRTAAPYGIIFTCLATGIVGLAYLLALLFVTVDIDAVVSGPTLSPVVNVFIQAGGQSFGAFLSWLICFNLFFAGVSSCTVTGRITFALMRDGAFPYSDFWAQVHPTTKAPVRALIFVFLFDALLLLLPLVSTAAFTSVVGICTIGFYVSYGIPIFLKLIFARDNFPVTPMSLGKWSNMCGVLSVGWLFGTSTILLFPFTYPLATDTMNWTIVVIGGFFFCGLVYWFAYARTNFRGPSRGNADVSLPLSDSTDKRQSNLTA